MIEYNKSESWATRGDNFCIEVKHWKSGDSNRWNVYAHIFEEHPIFKDIEKQKNLTLHWGPTYHKLKTVDDIEKHKWSKLSKTITIGSDYAHLYDERFEMFSTKEDAWEVFEDAEILFNELQGEQKND
jgi:hypothetical protein